MTAPVATGTGAEPESDGPAAPESEPAPPELELGSEQREPAAEHETAEYVSTEYVSAEYETAEYESAEYEPDDYELAERRISPLTIIGMTVAVLAIAAGVFVYVNHSMHPRTKVAYKVAAVFSLRPGDCFNSGQNGSGLTLRSCSTPHDAEVFARFTIPGSSWPGDATLQTEAESGCTSRISGYMNPAMATTALDQEYIYPDSLAWRAGVHTVICDVRSEDGPISGSVRQSS
jgi:Septum formation